MNEFLIALQNTPSSSLDLLMFIVGSMLVGLLFLLIYVSREK